MRSGEKENERGDVCGVDKALNGLVFHGELLLFFGAASGDLRSAFKNALQPWTIDGSGMDGVCRDTEFAEL